MTTPRTAAKVGDRVLISPSAVSGFTGQIGTVTETSRWADSVRILIDGHRLSMRFWLHEFEVL